MFYLIATIIITIVSVVLIIAIFLQKGKSAGLSSVISGQGSDTYWTKNRGRSKEGKLVRITTIAGIVFFVAAILLNVGAFVS